MHSNPSTGEFSDTQEELPRSTRDIDEPHWGAPSSGKNVPVWPIESVDAWCSRNGADKLTYLTALRKVLGKKTMTQPAWTGVRRAVNFVTYNN